MFRMVPQTVDHFRRLQLASTYFMDRHEQRETVCEMANFEHLIDMHGGHGALQLLSIEHLFLEFFHGLSRLDERLAHFTISAAVTSCDQIGNTTTLKERLQIRPRIEVLDELRHLHQAQSNDGRFGIVAVAKTVYETRTTCSRISSTPTTFESTLSKTLILSNCVAL